MKNRKLMALCALLALLAGLAAPAQAGMLPPPAFPGTSWDEVRITGYTDFVKSTDSIVVTLYHVDRLAPINEGVVTAPYTVTLYLRSQGASDWGAPVVTRSSSTPAPIEVGIDLNAAITGEYVWPVRARAVVAYQPGLTLREETEFDIHPYPALSAELAVAHTSCWQGNIQTATVRKLQGTPPYKCSFVWNATIGDVTDSFQSGPPHVGPPDGAQFWEEATVPAGAAKCSVTATLSDARGQTCTLTKDFGVRPELTVTQNYLNKATVGDVLTVTLDAVGGDLKHYVFQPKLEKKGLWVDLPEVTQAGNAFSWTVPYDPDLSRMYVYCVFVDKNGEPTFKRSRDVFIRPFLVSLTLDKDSIDEPGWVTATAAARGQPTLPVNYSIFFQVKQDGEWIDITKYTGPKEGARRSAHILFGEALKAVVNARDAAGNWDMATKEIPITNPIVTTPALSATGLVDGEALTVTHTATGGTPPYRTHAIFRPKLAGEAIGEYPREADGLSATFTPDQGDAVDVVTWLTDTLGRMSGETTLTCRMIQRGDVNGDGRIDMADLTLLVDHRLAGTPLKYPAAADVDRSGAVNDSDLKGIIDAFIK